MPYRVPMIIKIFRIELEDSESDVIGTIEYYSDRFKRQEITSYVWQENRALLRKELSCVKELEKDVAGYEADNELEPLAVLENLTEYLKGLVKERGYPELVNLVIERISSKVKRYLE